MKRLLSRARQCLLGFRDATDGIITIEMLITLPFLFWIITTTYELYNVYHFKSERVKATYTVADMLSREMLPVNAVYIDTAKAVFDSQARSEAENQVRMSVIIYEGATETYAVRWSEVRGAGPMAPLTTADVATAHDELPVLDGGEELIIVESNAQYAPVLQYPGLPHDYNITTKLFTGIRFASQLCWEGSFCG